MLVYNLKPDLGIREPNMGGFVKPPTGQTPQKTPTVQYVKPFLGGLDFSTIDYSSQNSAISTVAGQIGGSLGIPFVGELVGGLSELFAGSPPEAFANNAKTFRDVVVPSIERQYSQNPSKLLTEMHKAIQYMINFYEAHIAGSKPNTRAYQGNTMGMRIIESVESAFYQKINSLKSSYDVVVKRIDFDFNRMTLRGIKHHHWSNSARYLGFYNEYLISEKSDVGNVTTSSGSATGSSTGSSGKSDDSKISPLAWLLLPFGSIIALAIYFYNKYKKRK